MYKFDEYNRVYISKDGNKYDYICEYKYDSFCYKSDIHAVVLFKNNIEIGTIEMGKISYAKYYNNHMKLFI